MSDRITFAADVKAEGRRLRGSVTLAGSRTFRNGEWVEVDPIALMKADASNVIATIDHDPSKVTGRTFNSTLTLSRTETGIDFETADLPNTSYANDALELARGGYFAGSSFTIEGLRSHFNNGPDENGIRVRTINSIKRLSDVAIVMDPAFVNSSASAFSKESEVTAEPITPDVEPVAPPAPAPVAQFTAPKPDSDWAEIAKAATDEHLAGTADALFAKGDLEGYQREQYSAFINEIQSRKRRTAVDGAKFAQDQARHNAIMNRLPKAPAGDAELFASDDYAEAFKQYLRTGKSGTIESFAQSVAGSGAEGGYTVPDGFLQRVTERMVAFGGIAGVSDEITTSTGESLRWPTNDDTANVAAIAAEGVAGAAGADLVFGSINLGAFSYDANGASNLPLKVSLELLQDSAFDIAGMVSRKLGERLGRKQAAHLATGGGTTEPVGLLTKTPDAMTATAVSLAAPEHVFQVNSAYRDQGNCRWIMSDTTMVKIWQSQTTTNQPLFIPGGSDIVGKPGGTLLGYPITIDPGAGTLVAFGDFRLGYLIRRVRGIQVLVDPYTYQGTRQIGYHAWARMDANIQDAYAFSVSEWASVSADT